MVPFSKLLLCWFESALCMCSSGLRLILLRGNEGIPFWVLSPAAHGSPSPVYRKVSIRVLAVYDAVWLCNQDPPLGQKPVRRQTNMKFFLCRSFLPVLNFNLNLSVSFSECSTSCFVYLSRGFSCDQSVSDAGFRAPQWNQTLG